MIPLHTLPTFSFFFSFFLSELCTAIPPKSIWKPDIQANQPCMKVIFSRIPPHISWGWSSSGPDSRPSKASECSANTRLEPLHINWYRSQKNRPFWCDLSQILPSYQCLPGKKELEVICQFNTRAISVWIPHRYIPATLQQKKHQPWTLNTRTGLDMNSVHLHNSYASIQKLYSVFGFFKKSIYIYIYIETLVWYLPLFLTRNMNLT